MKNKTYFKNLDATRAIAFFLVFAGHMFIFYDMNNSSKYDSFFLFFKVGRFGVDYFFVLSGFLISWPWLTNTLKIKFSYKRFIIRRILRIWPLYFAIVLIGFSVFYFSKLAIYPLQEIPSIIYFISFTSNLYSSFYGADFLFFLVILWSVAIEFQFYILWGLVLKFSKNYIVYISFFLVLISLLFSCYFLNLKESKDLIYFHTLSSIGNFGMGVLVAVFSVKKGVFFNRLISFSIKTRICIYAILALSIFSNSFVFANLFSQIIERSFFSILFGYVIVDQCFNLSDNFNLGNNRTLSFLGKISYGLYCYHAMVITFLIFFLKLISANQNIYLTLFVYPIIILLTTIVVSIISYKLFESKFLRMKKRFY